MSCAENNAHLCIVRQDVQAKTQVERKTLTHV